MLHLDLETRSTVDLLKRGAHVYWDSLDTEVLVACWAIGDGEVQTWWPGEPCPAEIVSHVENGGMVAAHNSQFERLGWWHVLTPRHGWPSIHNEQFYCTATLARARGFPGKLEAAARFAGLPIAKDLEGYRLMLKMCKPVNYTEDGVPVWWENEEDLQRLAAYCRTDVEVERALAASLLPLTEQELADFHLSERINDRGVRVDVELAEVAVRSAAEEKLSADQTLTRLTHGAVTSHTQVQRIQDWARGRGVELPSLAKGAVLDALSEPLPDDVREVLEIRLEQAKAAVGKFQAVLDRNLDGVLHGMFMFRGAGQTGRFSSTGVQVHNLLRQTAPDATVNIVKARGVAGLRPLGDPVHLLAPMVRLLFIPDDDRLFLVGDYAAIEARIVAWLAGAERLLTGFREGKDVYCDFATEAFGRPITKADGLERFIGKTCILGLGFGGSEGALARGLAQGGLELEPARLTELVQLYRKQYAPEVPALWRALEDAAMLAITRRGHPQQAGRIIFLHDGTHLWCKLPSGRLMCYPFARLVDSQYGDAIQYRRGNRHPRRGEMHWPTVELWYGMMAENCCQAIALDLLVHAMHHVEAADLPVRLHIHDELVVEVDAEQATERQPDFEQLMVQTPDWAKGLPVAVESAILSRYRKA